MKKCLLFVWCLLAFSAAASAQTVTWDSEKGDGDGSLAPHNWVQWCDITPTDVSVDINALGYELYMGTQRMDAYQYEYHATSNIGTPLQLILNGSRSRTVRDAKEYPCPMSRRINIARRFLEMGADPNDGLYHQVGNNGDQYDELITKFFKIDTPLGYTARNGKLAIADLLLQNRADPNHTWNGFWQKTDSGAYEDKHAHFPLEQVVTSPVREYRPATRNQMIDLLVRHGADVNAVDDCGRTPLTRLLLCAAKVAPGICPVGFNQSDYRSIAYQLRARGASLKAKGQAQSSCRGMSVSAYDVWKDYMNPPDRDMWKDFFKGR